MWAKVESGSVVDLYPFPRKLTINNIQYDKNIFSMWTEAELNAVSIHKIIEDNTNLKDTNYYVNTNISYAFQSNVTINSKSYTNVVVASYGSSTAKSMADVLFTAEDETAIPSQVEGTIKTPGLKTQMK